MADAYTIPRRFELIHPLVVLVWFAATLGATMLSLHPVLLGLSLVCAATALLVYGGGGALLRSLRLVLTLALGVVLLNLAFNHRGMTVLFRIGRTRFTREALYFALAEALLLVAAALWCTLWQELMPSDKFLYLFGRIAPTTALVTSMILRWVPLTADRARQIRRAQDMLYITRQTSAADKRPHRPAERFAKIRAAIRQAGVLMSWSMEDSIEAADSMRARGYVPGRRRGSFRSWRFRFRDAVLVSAALLLGAGQLFVQLRFLGTLAYYPVIRGMSLPPLVFLPALLLFALPLLCEGGERCRWLAKALATR
jgi:energy-coupling factor transport system permease protein